MSSALKDNRVPSRIWNTDLFLGHMRAASQSLKNDKGKNTTHPFKTDTIIGAHNGYINNWRSLASEHKEEHPITDTFSVDSEMIFFLLAKKGLKGLEELSGSASAWWVDTREPGKVYLWANNQTLHIGKDKNSVYFSSEADHLRQAGFRKGIINLKDDGQVIRIDRDALDFCKIGTHPSKKYVAEVSAGFSGFSRNRQVMGASFRMDEYACDEFGNRFLPAHYQPLRPALKLASETTVSIPPKYGSDKLSTVYKSSRAKEIARLVKAQIDIPFCTSCIKCVLAEDFPSKQMIVSPTTGLVICPTCNEMCREAGPEDIYFEICDVTSKDLEEFIAALENSVIGNGLETY
jgi:hypothetical protein